MRRRHSVTQHRKKKKRASRTVQPVYRRPYTHSYFTGHTQIFYRTHTAILPDKQSYLTGHTQLLYRTYIATLAAHMLSLSGLSVALALTLFPGTGEALKEGDCEVCITFLGKLYQSLEDDNVAFNSADIEKAVVRSCRDARGKDNRFCYYIGATSDAATKMINEVSKPLSHHVPVDKICEKLKKKDGQICDLKYDKLLDLTTVDLKKLKVKDLKKILEEWGESCKGCAEKSDFIRKITELMPKYAPAAARARTDL